MKPVTVNVFFLAVVLISALALLGCHASADVFDVDAGDSDAGEQDAGDTDTETESDTGCVEAILALYDAGCYLACDHLDDGTPTNCWWTDDTDGDQVLGLTEIESACLFWESSECSYHLEMMLECWASEWNDGCPEGCDGDDPNGVTMWECLDAA
jgi:hypothetical protein